MNIGMDMIKIEKLYKIEFIAGMKNYYWLGEDDKTVHAVILLLWNLAI